MLETNPNTPVAKLHNESMNNYPIINRKMNLERDRFWLIQPKIILI